MGKRGRLYGQRPYGLFIVDDTAGKAIQMTADKMRIGG